jgi:hypothetical protein
VAGKTTNGLREHAFAAKKTLISNNFLPSQLTERRRCAGPNIGTMVNLQTLLCAAATIFG